MDRRAWTAWVILSLSLSLSESQDRLTSWILAIVRSMCADDSVSLCVDASFEMCADAPLSMCADDSLILLLGYETL